MKRLFAFVLMILSPLGMWAGLVFEGALPFQASFVSLALLFDDSNSNDPSEEVQNLRAHFRQLLARDEPISDCSDEDEEAYEEEWHILETETSEFREYELEEGASRETWGLMEKRDMKKDSDTKGGEHVHYES